MLKIAKTALVLITAAAGAALAPSAHAAWTFNSSTTASNGAGEATVQKVEGYSFASGGNWSKGNLTYYSGGGEGMLTGTDSGEPFHALDNNGTTEGVLVQFSSSVVLKEIGLGYVSNNTYSGSTLQTNGSLTVDLSVFRYIGNGPPPLAGANPLSMSGWELVGNYGDMLYNTNMTDGVNAVNSTNKGSSWWLISAYNAGFTGAKESRSSFDANNDYFKLFALAGTACTGGGANCGFGAPEPATLALVGLGIAAVLSTRRRRSAAQASA